MTGEEQYRWSYETQTSADGAAQKRNRHSGTARFAGVMLLTFAVCFAFLFGVLASLYVLRRGNLWGACAIHSMWNFAQGNLFGAAVSGNRSGPSLLRAEAIASGSASLWNGGAFGPEGGLAVTLVLLAGIAVLLFLIPNAKEGADQAF